MLHAASTQPDAQQQSQQSQQTQQPAQQEQPRNQSPAASFFAALNQGRPAEHHPRSFSYGAAGAPPRNGFAGHGPSQAAVGANVGRSQSLRNPTSFAAAGSNLQGTTNTNFTPPAAARHPLFSHHAVPPGQHAALPNPYSPTPSVMSDPGPVPPMPLDITSQTPPSPSGSNTSSAFSPASAFLSHFSSRSSAPETIAPDAQGARVLDYTLGKVLGRGGFSTVRQAIHVRTGEVLACKIVKRDDLSEESGSLERFEDEIRIWKSLPKHDRILPLIEMTRTPYASFLIMPCLKGSLLDILRIEGGSEVTARKWFPNVVAAVAILHEGFEGFEGGMLHGDLKLDNFLVDHHDNVCVGDFGMARRINRPASKLRGPSPASHRPTNMPSHLQVRGRLATDPRSGRMPSRSPSRRRDTLATTDVTQQGNQPCPSASLPYASPELLGSVPVLHCLAQDIWALGIILYALLTGRLPFTDSFDPRLQMKILRGQWEEPYVGHEWLEALHGTLHRDPARRWDIRRVRECDAVTGWREVKPKSRSRSRARLPDGAGGRRTPGDSPIHAHHPDSGIPTRGRNRSRSGVRHGGIPHSPHHHRRDGPPTTPGGTTPHDGDGRYLHPSNQGSDRSRSRSQSATRRSVGLTPRSRPNSRPGSVQINSDAARASAQNSPERLAHDMDGMTITRGRSTQRAGFTPITGERRSPSSSASSLHVADGEQRTNSRSRSAPRGQRPLSGTEQRRGRSRARNQEDVPGSAAWWEAAFGARQQQDSPSSTGSGAHTPQRSRGSPGHGQTHAPHGHGYNAHGHHGHAHHGHGHGHPVESFVSAHSATHSASSSRPPTLGFELDVVDEDAPARGRRGQTNEARGGSRSHSRARRGQH